MKKVILISGSPGAGKTTYALTLSSNIFNQLELFEQDTIILDDISNFVTNIEDIFPYIENVQTLIITDPYLTFPENREKAIQIFQEKHFTVECIDLKISFEEAKQRIKNRNDDRKISDTFLKSFFPF